MKIQGAFPDERGYYNEFGGRFVPETLMPVLTEMEAAYNDVREDLSFMEE